MAGTAVGASKRWGEDYQPWPKKDAISKQEAKPRIVRMLRAEPGKHTEKSVALSLGLTRASIQTCLNQIEQEGISLMADPETDVLSIYRDYQEKDQCKQEQRISSFWLSRSHSH